MLVALLFPDKRRKDFWQMLIHHIACVVLLGLSFWMRFHRAGLMALWLHDMADIFLYMGKSARYLEFQVLPFLIYAVFMPLFFWSRCCVWTWVSCPSGFFEIGKYIEHTGLASTGHVHWWYYVVVFFSAVLCVLHYFWFCLIIKVML